MPGMIPALAMRPADCASPKPEARALVGNTSAIKICEELPASWMKNVMMKIMAMNISTEFASPTAMAASAARMKAATAVGLRPNFSSAYIMNALASGNAKLMPAVYSSDVLTVNPCDLVIMLGSQLPRPSATPKKALKQVERAPPLAMRRQPARRLGERKAQHEDDQGENANHRPDPAPADRIAEEEDEYRADRPRPGAADKLHQRDDPPANAFRRVLGGVRKAQRLLRSEAKTGEKAESDQPLIARRPGAGDRRQAEQQQVELVDRLAAKAVGELALPECAEEQAQQRRGADQSALGRRHELAVHHVGNQRAENRVVDHVAEISGGNEAQHPPMGRPHGGVVHRLANKTLDRL